MLRVVLLVVAALAALAALRTPAAPAHATAVRCSETSNGKQTVAKVVDVLHGSVFVGGKYIGAAPFDIRDGDRVCTDSRGQVIFDFSPAASDATCNTLPSSAVRISSGSVVRASFEAGKTWCVARPSNLWFAVFSGRIRIRPVTSALFGIEINGSAATVRVVSGRVQVRAATRKYVSQSRQVTLTATGAISAGTSIFMRAEDRVAVAQLPKLAE